MWWAIGLILIIVTIVIGIKQSNNEKLVKEKESKLKELGWSFTHQYLNGQQGFIVVDENNKKIACYSLSKNHRKLQSFNYEEILSCEILTDGETTYKKSVGGSLGRALVGGVLLGGVGAVVGGVTGSTKKNVKVKKLELKLVIRDTHNPNWLIKFYDSTAPAPGFTLKKSTNEINKWKDIFSIIIDSIDNSKDKPLEPLVLKGDIYEQLQKISDLKDKGVLTDEEFVIQKSKILSV